MIKILILVILAIILYPVFLGLKADWKNWVSKKVKKINKLNK